MSAQQLARNIAQRIPLIKFKYGKRTGGIVSGHSLNNNAAQTNSTANRPVSQSSTLEFFQLPKKYHRKQITVDEIETINKGGF